MELDKTKIEKLRDSDNWHQWQFVIQTILDSEEALDVCEGNQLKPEESETNYDQKLKKWNKADRTARKLFVTTVENKPLQLLMNCVTAQEMWQKLHSVYDLKSDESLSLVQKKFFDFKWDSGSNIAQHISQLEQLAVKMKKLGGEIPHSMLMTRILSTLPSKYNYFYSAWNSTQTSQKTLDTLTTRLLTEELRLEKQSGDEEDSTVALFLKLNFKSKRFNKNKQKFGGEESGENVTRCSLCRKSNHEKKDCKGCFSCGSKEHLLRDCPEKNGSAQTKREVFVGNISIGDNSDSYWIIDSGASNHISNKREWFREYTEFVDPKPVYVGNGDQVLAMGSGNIDVETFDGKEWIPATLHEVLFIPDMTKNLFSVKISAKKGVDFILSDNGSKCLFKRSNKVIAVGIEADNLYRLKLRVISPETACVAYPSETLQLWHERLCHQNKKYVKSFIKKESMNLTDDNVFCDACAYG
jgi:hypothetical protein